MCVLGSEQYAAYKLILDWEYDDPSLRCANGDGAAVQPADLGDTTVFEGEHKDLLRTIGSSETSNKRRDPTSSEGQGEICMQRWARRKLTASKK